MNTQTIKLAHSTSRDPAIAAAEFHASVVQADMELVLFFCSSEYDLDLLATEMNRLFAGVQLIGCTTAGEIGPAGYQQHSLSGASFGSSDFKVVSGLLEKLSTFEISQGHGFVQELLQQLENKAPEASPENSFAMMLIDGLSVREEIVAHSLQYALGNIMLFGGSAGDDQQFNKSYVFIDGQFISDSAVLILMNTTLPFKIFKTQHFVSSDERLVVTEADTTHRIVTEINGLPAAAEYARLVGVEVHELNAMRFAASPVVVLIDGTDYVRSIQKVNPDGSLTFFCAIEEGVVFRVAHGESMLANLQDAVEALNKEIGPPQLMIGCDCILRKLEATQNGLKAPIEKIFQANNSIGFSSYGEQYHGVHINQTLAGIAIGSSTTEPCEN